MAIDELQTIVIKSIESYARVETRVGSLEQSINLLRQENDKILGKISESLERLASIQEKLSRNADDHRTLHSRIDENKNDHEEIIGRLEITEKTVQELSHPMRLINYQVLGIPLWMGLVGMVLLGFLSDISNHYEWVKKWK